MKLTRPHLPLVALFTALAASPSLAQSFSLASTMDTSTGLSENLVTGSQARIGFGDGSPGDADGLYDVNDSNIAFGAVDVFPNEAAFSIGSLGFDGAGVTGVGTETVSVTSLDLSALWAADSATTDISDVGLDLWFFGIPNSFAFGALDPTDTVTFVDGVLDSIDVEIVASYDVFDGAGNPVSWVGSFSVTGSTVALAINDTQTFNTGPFLGNQDVPSTFISDLSGTVNAVGVYVIPEPAGLATLAALALVAGRMRRRA